MSMGRPRSPAPLLWDPFADCDLHARGIRSPAAPLAARLAAFAIGFSAKLRALPFFIGDRRTGLALSARFLELARIHNPS